MGDQTPDAPWNVCVVKVTDVIFLLGHLLLSDKDKMQHYVLYDKMSNVR